MILYQGEEHPLCRYYPTDANLSFLYKMSRESDMVDKSDEGPTSQHIGKIAEGEKVPDTNPWDAETRRQERRLVRKLDMTLMPMVWVLYLFNYLDRNNIA